ncbi:MAG TPA: TrkA C-terminal domain-containing protein, partial [Oscillospiraceae bacterium]|nr:TrkA C-terminal domain-containing protein [Oscillospiraceae bacterium]
IVETVVPKSWEGKSLRDLNVRARSGVNIIGIRRKDEDDIEVNPAPDDVLRPGDEVVALGADEDISRLHKL